MVVDSTGNALFSTLRALYLPPNVLNASAAVYDVAARSWSKVGPLPLPSVTAPTVTRLHDGSILAAGGQGSGGLAQNASRLSPATLTATATGSMQLGREYHTLVTTFNGSALAIGGVDFYGALGRPDRPGAMLNPFIETYVPFSGSWAPEQILRYGGPRVLTPRNQHVSIVLPR